jgi:hypothetical protein
MSDALRLPPHPNLEQYRKLAKELQSACRSGTIREWAAELDEETAAIEHRWRKFQEQQPRAAACLLADVQFFLARLHGFASWPKFARHIREVTLAGSPDAAFESAADAIIQGDVRSLETLLREHPALVRARSAWEHRSTLLHYVSANGVEDFRQKTPQNIVDITRILLDAGADVNAESDAYGGRSTTLGLTATSYHPDAAGVQIPLLELLLDRGARIDGADGASTVSACLHNGRGPAAEFLASRGARLDLEGVSGVGRLDLVQSFFAEDGTLIPPANSRQMSDGFAWACEFGRIRVVEFLLQRGMAVEARLPVHGATGLHWAALHAHADIVKLLLERGARVDVRDDSFDGTSLDWALHARGRSRDRSYDETVELLTRAGSPPSESV